MRAFFDTFTNVVKNVHGNGERQQMGAERAIFNNQYLSIVFKMLNNFIVMIDGLIDD